LCTDSEKASPRRVGQHGEASLNPGPLLLLIGPLVIYLDKQYIDHDPAVKKAHPLSLHPESKEAPQGRNQEELQAQCCVICGSVPAFNP